MRILANHPLFYAILGATKLELNRPGHRFDKRKFIDDVNVRS